MLVGRAGGAWKWRGEERRGEEGRGEEGRAEEKKGEKRREEKKRGEERAGEDRKGRRRKERRREKGEKRKRKQTFRISRPPSNLTSRKLAGEAADSVLRGLRRADVAPIGTSFASAMAGKSRRLAVEAAGRKILGDTSSGGVPGAGMAQKLKRLRRARLERMAAAGSGKFPRSAFG